MKKTRQVRSNVKVLLTVFFDCNGLAHHEFLQEIVWWIRNTTLKFWTNWASNSLETHRIVDHGFCNMITHQVTHRCLCVSFLLKTKSRSCLNHRIHWIGFLLVFSFSPKLKTRMKGKRFSTIEEIKELSKQELLAVEKFAFQKCFED